MDTYDYDTYQDGVHLTESDTPKRSKTAQNIKIIGVLLCEVTQINLKLSIKMTIDLANILDRNCDSLFQAFRWWRAVRSKESDEK